MTTIKLVCSAFQRIFWCIAVLCCCIVQTLPVQLAQFELVSLKIDPLWPQLVGTQEYSADSGSTPIYCTTTTAMYC